MSVIISNQSLLHMSFLVAAGFAVGAIAGGTNGYRLNGDKNIVYRIAAAGVYAAVGAGVGTLAVCGIRSQQYVNHIRRITKINFKSPSFTERLHIGSAPNGHWSREYSWHEYGAYESAKRAAESAKRAAEHTEWRAKYRR